MTETRIVPTLSATVKLADPGRGIRAKPGCRFGRTSRDRGERLSSESLRADPVEDARFQCFPGAVSIVSSVLDAGYGQRYRARRSPFGIELCPPVTDTRASPAAHGRFAGVAVAGGQWSMMTGCVCCSPLLRLWAMSIQWFRSPEPFSIEVTMFVGLPARMRVTVSSRPESPPCQSGLALEKDERSIGAAIPTPKTFPASSYRPTCSPKCSGRSTPRRGSLISSH